MHVTSETRTIYRSARGWKLQRHAAYVGAAKTLITAKCRELRGDGSAKCENQCRFHELAPYDPTAEVGGMVYYVKWLPRLIRFLKFVDRCEAGDA